MIARELALVTQAYACTRSPVVRSHPVHHGQFRGLSAQFGRLLTRIEDAEDPYWTSLLRFLRRVRFELAALPVPFNAPCLGLATLQAAMEGTYSRCATLYPSLAPAVHDVLAAAGQVVSCEDAPLLSRLAAIVEATPLTSTAIVLCEARLIKMAELTLRQHPVLRGCVVIGPAQLRSLPNYNRLLCVGSARWFPEYVTAAPRAPVIDFVHFQWTPGPARPAPLFAVPGAEVNVGAGARTTEPTSSSGLPTIVGVGDDTQPAEDEAAWFHFDEGSLPSKSLLQELVHRANAANGAGDHRHDLVRALPVALEGGCAVFLDSEDHASVLVLDLAERGKSRVRRIPTADIEEGMFVLLRAAGGGDYVVPVADAVLGRRAAECRQVQREWKAGLRAQVEANGLFATSIALLDLGAVRADEGNVRRWIWDRSIRPRDHADFLAILRLIGLESKATQYWRTMALIDRAHIKAGQLIRGMLLKKVMQSDLVELERHGSMEFDLPGSGTGRMIACRVLRAAREPVMTSASNVGRPFTVGDAPWQ